MLSFKNIHDTIGKEKHMGLNLKDDIIFKAFFTKKGNEKYLKSFLESLLQESIDKIEIIRRGKFATTKKSR